MKKVLLGLFFIGAFGSFGESADIPGMVFVAGGCYEMGSTEGEPDEQPVHTVCLDDFYMDKHEVSQKAYRKVMGKNPSQFKGCPQCPVERVTWEEAYAYCGKTGKRLPTEAEWEYAARSGGKSEKYAGTSDENKITGYAWLGDNAGDKTHPVGRKKPNALGLYDMSGNVGEWVSDWYDVDYYKQSPEKNPAGPSGDEYRILRGGSWSNCVHYLRASYRSGVPAAERNDFGGFRCSRDK